MRCVYVSFGAWFDQALHVQCHVQAAGLLKRLLYSEATGADMFHNSHTTFNDQMVLGMVLGRAAGVGVYNSIRCRSIVGQSSSLLVSLLQLSSATQLLKFHFGLRSQVLDLRSAPILGHDDMHLKYVQQQLIQYIYFGPKIPHFQVSTTCVAIGQLRVSEPHALSLVAQVFWPARLNCSSLSKV